MSLDIRVEDASAVPPYEQIRSQILGHISTGALGAGDRLPAMRALAADLGVAVGTVARAYRELENAGIVVTARRHGTVVAATSAAVSPKVMLAASDLVRTGREATMTDEEVLDVVRGVLAGSTSKETNRP